MVARKDASTMDTGQEVRRFRQHSLGRHNRTGPLGKGTTAFLMVRLAAIEERDEGTGIKKQFAGHASRRRGRTHDVAPRDLECQTPAIQ